MSIKVAIDQLQTYRGPAELTLHIGADEALLRTVENTYNITLPDDFKELYRFSDGFKTVEDIFNMIPLTEIVENNGRHDNDAFYIAEYMIYSDMWQLEINPDNCNDYKIIVQANGNKLVLTNSLAEFIERFLKGGVFDTGGLYDWAEEVELQPIYTTKLKTAELLLTVFFYSVRFGLISTKEVIDWADQIVIRENEPEYFFIELSLSHNENELVSILNSISVPENSVVVRAILGLLYHRLSASAITFEEAIAVMDKIDFSNLLTQPEKNHINSFTDEIWLHDQTAELGELTENLLNFLANYKELQIVNYKYWLGHSYHIEYKFTKEENAPNPIDQQALSKGQSKLKQQQALIFATACTLGFVSAVIAFVTYGEIADKAELSKFRLDLYQISRLYLTFFLIYYLFDGVRWLLSRLK